MVAQVVEQIKQTRLGSKVLLGEESRKSKLNQKFSKTLSVNALTDYLKIVDELEKNRNNITTHVKFNRKLYNLDWNEDFFKIINEKPLNIEPIKVAKYSPVNSNKIEKNLIPAISCVNDNKNIVNTNAIAFPKDINKIKPIEKTNGEIVKEKLKNLGRKEQSEETQSKIEASNEGFRYNLTDDEDEDQSILVQKLRELVIRFEKLLAKYLDPDIPKGRADRKKWEREEQRFRAFGYKGFINSIDLKVEALCNFEGYKKEQFCLDADKNWFKRKIAEALKGNFYSAQEVVNSVMQIVKEEEYAVPKRRIVAKLK